MHGFQGDNESLLFHGASQQALEAIVNEGFDIRVANPGSLGTGQTQFMSLQQQLASAIQAMKG